MKKLMHTKFISYTAVLAFVLNTFLPVWVAYASPDHELKNVNELSQTTFFEDKILICTTQGFKWVSLADLEEQNNTPSSQHRFKCPLCYLPVHTVDTAIIQSQEPINYAHSLHLIQYVTSDSDTVHDDRFYRHRHNRAPPSFTFVS